MNRLAESYPMFQRRIQVSKCSMALTLLDETEPVVSEEGFLAVLLFRRNSTTVRFNIHLMRKVL